MEAIAVKHAANAGTPDAVLATDAILDINGLSPGIGGCRQIPRRRQPRSHDD